MADKLLYSADFVIHEDIPGPIEISLEVNRCSLNLKKCEKYPTVRTIGFCEAFKKKAIYADSLTAFKPPLQCPIKAGNYSATDAELDLGIISFLPSQGYIWLVCIRAFGGASKTLVMCIQTETKITEMRKRNSSSRKS